ncbi:MAG TPA: FecR family protein, partial [Nitrospinaceae bacterium]|nr:FecR family protein [Nitrospinaceae bacterium]
MALFLSALFAVPVLAQQGLLLLEKGSAKVIGPERTRLLRKPGAKIVLQAKDRVQTGKDTFVKIRIKGKPEIIELSSRSFFRMGKITRQTSSISLLTGKARFKIQGKLKKKSKRKRFQIRTVTALVGVRGTDFVVGASNTQTSLLTISGTVSVAPVSMPDIEIEVPANQASTVPQNSTPTAPVEVAPKMREQIVKADSPGAFKNVKFGEAVDPEEVRKENEKKKKEEEEEQKKEEKSKEEGEPGDEEGEPGDEEGEPGDEEGEPGDEEGEPGDEEGEP